ncbi:MAG: hypothetical protein M5R36_27125 [Deltaproteobacteria bacterium]|nr:hypothetical protein [Deltaproteobacteria bacterium]
MQMLRSVDAQAQVEVVLLEELAPRLVEQHAVGLEVVPDADCSGVFLLQLDDPPTEIQTYERRLPAVPVEDNFVNLLAGNVLTDELLEEIVGDPAGPVG